MTLLKRGGVFRRSDVVITVLSGLGITSHGPTFGQRAGRDPGGMDIRHDLKGFLAPMHVPLWIWGLTALGVVGLLLFDFYSHVRDPHEPSMKEAGLWTAIYIGLAVVFGFGIWEFWGRDEGVQFFAGFLTEYSLSIDNLFVMLLIISTFAVPRHFQRNVLLVGIGLAILLRGIFIALGAAIVENFSWIFYIFGVFLLYTGWQLARSDDQEEEYREDALIRFVRRLVPVANDYADGKVMVVRNGQRMITPMAIVMIAIGSANLLFAFDSIPAIFGLTQEPYIVFMTNAWALMGLRQLYFLLGGLLERLVYLSYGLAFILAWIGVKMITHALHDNELPFLHHGKHFDSVPEVPTLLSLLVIVGTIGVAAIFSIRKTRSDGDIRPDAA